MIYYNQRDPKWKNKKLGFSSRTIGEKGCTITVLGMLADLTPDEVNEKLKKVNGFAQKNLVIWKKISCLGLEFIWRGWKYENEKVKEAIKNYGFCLVNVMAGKIKHWVVYTGNQKCIDPWDGREKPTSTYPPIGYCIIKKIEVSEIPYKKELDVCLEQHTKLVDEIKKVKEAKDQNWEKWKIKEKEADVCHKDSKQLRQRLAEIIGEPCTQDPAVILGEVQGLKEKENDREKIQEKFDTHQAEVIANLKKLGGVLGVVSEFPAVLGALEQVCKAKTEKEKEILTLERKNLSQKVIIDRYKKLLKGKGVNMEKNTLWEAVKEPLRLLVLAILPFLAVYFEKLSYGWAGIVLLVLRLADKLLHEWGKKTENEVLVKGLTRF